ncbi:MAG: histidinol-phosphate transaminase [Eubacteriales bacterium]|nr:histidinol-phosphate transaminase [Eubacteriales bacterium]
MSRFFSEKYAFLTPYTPGEQPQNRKYVKLNTNENPFPPSEKAVRCACEEAKRLELYSDPECRGLTDALAEMLGVEKNEVLLTNGSDEILNFAFMAYCDDQHTAAFPDITYGFYPVFAEINRIPYTEIPLREDFTIDIRDYFGIQKTIFLANPNAPTGISLTKSDIEQILKENPDNIVVIDEAYVDFGSESCVGLIHSYDNLLVTQTFSKSRSMAGARLGFGVGNASLISDLNAIKYSTNPYNINRMTMAAGIGVLADEEYTQANCRTIMDNRAYTFRELEKLGFECLDSQANFIFAKHPAISGQKLYEQLKERGVLIRHFSKERIRDYNRITIGSMEQMQILINTLKEIL